MELHAGGRVIKTTAEHPFFVRGKGWLPAGELQIGQLLASHDGQWVSVDDVCDTGESATLYNLRVADYRTYFVGSSEWGFSVWAHNICVVEVVPGVGMERVSGRLTRAQAIELAREGENIAASTLKEAKEIAQAASPVGRVAFDAERVLENGVRIPGHYHPIDITGERMAAHIYGP